MRRFPVSRDPSFIPQYHADEPSPESGVPAPETFAVPEEHARDGTPMPPRGVPVAAAVSPPDAETPRAPVLSETPSPVQRAPALHVPEIPKPKELRTISLIPGARAPRAPSRPWAIVVGAGVAAVALIGILAGLLAWQRARTVAAVAVADAEREELIRAVTRARAEATAFAAAAQRAAATRALLAQHRSWSAALRLLEARTLPAVTYANLQADVTGAVTMTASAPDVRTAMEQVVAWQSSDFVRAAEISSTASTVDALGVTRGVRFDLRLTFDPALFLATPAVGSAG